MKFDGVGVKNTQNHTQKCVFTPKYAFLNVQHRLATKKRRPTTKTAFFPCFKSLQNHPTTKKRHPATDDRKLKNRHRFIHKF